MVSGPIYYTVDFLLYPALAFLVDLATPHPVDSFQVTTIPSVTGDLRKKSVISGFSDVEEENYRKRLQLSAFKWFRVVNGSASLSGYPGRGPETGVPYSADLQNLNPITLPDNGIGEPFELEFGWAFPDQGFTEKHHIEFLSQFELQDFCCERTESTDTVNGEVKDSNPFRRPFVWGAFYHESDGISSDDKISGVNSIEYITGIVGDEIPDLSYLREDDTQSELRRYICPVSFELDKQLGLVKFSDIVYLLNISQFVDGEEANSIQWPELALRCAIRVKNKATGNWIRRERVRELDPNSPAKEIVYHLDDINVYYEIDGTSNVDAVNRLMDEFINSIHIKLTRKLQSASATYAKWFQFELDGAIQSITWSMSESGARMAISRNIDTGSDTAMEYDQRLRKTQFKKNAEWVARRDLFAKREEFGL